MPQVERPGFRPKSPEQLKEQTKAVSERIGHHIIPAPLGEEAYATEDYEIKQRFPLHHDVYIEELKAAKAQEHTIFIPTPEKVAHRDRIVATWQHLTPLVDNLNRSVEARQRGGGEIQRVRLKERQFTIFEDMRDHIADGDTEGTIQAPTGFGKTVIFNQLVQAANVPTLILVPTQDLVEQTYMRFQRFTPDIPIGRVYVDKKEYGKQVTVTTYQSLLAGDEVKLINQDGIGLVIFDEVHNVVSKRRVLKVESVEQFKNAVFVGLSATPVEIQDKRFAETRVAKMTQKIWHTVLEREAIEEGYLSPFSALLVEVDIDLANVKVTRDGNYDEADLEKKLNQQTANQAAVQFFLEVRESDREAQRKSGKKEITPLITSVYANSVAHAKQMASDFQSAGISAAAVWGTNNSAEKAEHKRIMKQWEKGEIEVVCSKDKLVQGLDVQSIRFVMNVAPTTSKKVEKQRSGRGLRVDENNPDKHAIIADFVYKNSNKRHLQVTYPQLLGSARIVRKNIDAQEVSGGNGGVPVDLSNITIAGLKVITITSEVMKIVQRMVKEREEIQPFNPETEFGFTALSLQNTFIGGEEKLWPLTNEVLVILEQEYPGSNLNRISSNNLIRAISFKFYPRFIELIQERGIELQTAILPLDPEKEFPITQRTLRDIFSAHTDKLNPILNEVFKILEQEHPGSIMKRRQGKTGRPIPAIPLFLYQRFVALVLERGIKLVSKDKFDPTKDINVGINQVSNMFIGDRDVIAPALNEVLKILEKENQGTLVMKKQLSSQSIPTIPLNLRKRFIKLMRERGMKLQDSIQPLNSQKEFGVTNSNLGSLFRGTTTRLRPISEQVLEILEKENPGAVLQRRSENKRIIKAIPLTLYFQFMKLMQEKRVRLK